MCRACCTHPTPTIYCAPPDTRNKHGPSRRVAKTRIKLHLNKALPSTCLDLSSMLFGWIHHTQQVRIEPASRHSEITKSQGHALNSSQHGATFALLGPTCMKIDRHRKNSRKDEARARCNAGCVVFPVKSRVLKTWHGISTNKKETGPHELAWRFNEKADHPKENTTTITRASWPPHHPTSSFPCRWLEVLS